MKKRKRMTPEESAALSARLREHERKLRELVAKGRADVAARRREAQPGQQ